MHATPSKPAALVGTLGLLILSGLVPGLVASASGAAFTAGDVAVYRAGSATNPVGTTSGVGTPVFIDEYGPTGTLVQSIALPTTASGSNKPLVEASTATSEGLVTLSPNGNYLLATGYDAAVGATGLTSSSSTTVPRTVAELTSTGSVDTSTALTDFATGNNPRSATTVDGTNVWVAGAAGSVRATTIGATTSAAITSTTDKNFREVSAYNGQLYASADPTKNGGTGNPDSFTVASVGTGTPTTGTNTVANLPFATGAAPAEPYEYAFVTLGSGTAPDTLYVADNAGGTTSNGAVRKYSLVSGTWTAEGSIDLQGVEGLTANDANGTVTIYATTTTTGSDGKLYSIVDSSGIAGTLSATPTLLATAPSGETFRGVAFVPGTTFGTGGGTTGTGGGGGTGGTAPTVTPAEPELAAALGDPTNPTMTVTVGDTATGVMPSDLTVMATSSDPSVATNVTVSGTGATRTITLTPGVVGRATITVTATAPDMTTGSATFLYGVSPNEGDASDRYYAGAGNGSAEIGVGSGYMLVGDDLSNVLRLYQDSQSGPPVASFDFSSQFPAGTGSIDIESAARSGNTIYWFGSQSSNTSSNIVFATQVSGSGAATTLTYLGSYTGLEQDLIAWDHANGDAFGLTQAAGQPTKSATGLNVEGAEFAAGSSSTIDLGFRAPLEPFGTGSSALVVPVTNLTTLATSGNVTSSAGTHATFGTAMQWNLGGLAIRDIRKNADDQYLIIAGTPDGSNTSWGLYTWDGNPAHAPTLTTTTLPTLFSGEAAWEGIVDVPDPLTAGTTVELVQDNGDTGFYGDAQTSKNGLPVFLQKDLGRTFTISLPAQTVSFTSPAPTEAVPGGTYTPTATATSGLPVSFSIDASSTAGACSLSGGVVSFTGVGTCVVDANQGGSLAFAPAPQKQQSFTIATTASTSTPTPVSGTVSPTLSLSVNNAATSLGSFVPGVATTYTTTLAATVTSTGGSSTLTVQDPSSTATGHLVNGTFALASPLEADATDAAHPTAAFAPLGTGPLTILTLGGPVTNDAVTVGFAQPITQTEGLRTGSYGKTLTLTLSTATP